MVVVLVYGGTNDLIDSDVDDVYSTMMTAID